MKLSDVPTPKFKIGDVVIYAASSSEAWQSNVKNARCVLEAVTDAITKKVVTKWVWYYRVEIVDGALFTEDLLKDVREITK